MGDRIFHGEAAGGTCTGCHGADAKGSPQATPWYRVLCWPMRKPQACLSMCGCALKAKFSHQLRAAEDRIAELEAEVGMYQEKADRAEQWLHRVYTEIEDRFLRQGDESRGTPQRRRGVHSSR